jgi:hypothetical protein
MIYRDAAGRLHATCGITNSPFVKGRKRFSFASDARDARSDAAEDFVRYGSGPAGVIVGGDALSVLLTQDDNFVSGGGAGDVGDIDYGQVHRNAADDWGGAPVDEHVTTRGGIGAG